MCFYLTSFHPRPVFEISSFPSRRNWKKMKHTHFPDLWPFLQGTVCTSVVNHGLYETSRIRTGRLFLSSVPGRHDQRNKTLSLPEFTLNFKKSQELAQQNAITYQWIIVDKRDDPYLPSMCQGNPKQGFLLSGAL